MRSRGSFQWLFVFSRPRSWSMVEHGSAHLPYPPTGTDGHPRSSLISLQSGNDPCYRDVAALFKYDARCSPTFSMSSHCPGKPEGERGEEVSRRTQSHHAAWALGYWAHCVVLTALLFPSLCLFCCSDGLDLEKGDVISIWRNFRVSCTSLYPTLSLLRPNSLLLLST